MDRRRFLLLLLGVAVLAFAVRATWILVETRHQEPGTFANAGSATQSESVYATTCPVAARAPTLRAWLNPWFGWRM